jgi:hypothetical protein
MALACTSTQFAKSGSCATDLPRLDGATTREELDAEHHQRKHQHDVDVGAEGVEADPTE